MHFFFSLVQDMTACRGQGKGRWDHWDYRVHGATENKSEASKGLEEKTYLEKIKWNMGNSNILLCFYCSVFAYKARIKCKHIFN